MPASKGKKTVTIIKSKGYVTHYPLQAIDEELAYKLLMSPTTLDRDNGSALQLFDCHCHLLPLTEN